MLLTDKHEVEQAGKNNGNEILADCANQVEDILDVVEIHCDYTYNDVGGDGIDIEKLILSSLLGFSIFLV